MIERTKEVLIENPSLDLGYIFRQAESATSLFICDIEEEHGVRNDGSSGVVAGRIRSDVNKLIPIEVYQLELLSLSYHQEHRSQDCGFQAKFRITVIDPNIDDPELVAICEKHGLGQ